MNQYDKYKTQQLRTFDKTPAIKNWRQEMKNPRSNQELLNMVLAIGEPKDGAIAYDIGAGSAYHTTDLIEIGYESYGIELSQKRVNDAHTMGRSYIRQGDMHELPWDNNSADLVFMHETLEHSMYPGQVLNEIIRVLKPGGTFVASLPLEAYWKSKQEAHEHDFDLQDCHPWKPDAEDVYNAMSVVGFNKVEIKLYTLDSIQFKMNYNKGDIVSGFRPHCFVKGIKNNGL